MFSNIQISFFFYENSKIDFKICSYIQKMTLEIIETLKTSIHNPKHTKNMKQHFMFSQIFKKFKNPYFQKLEVQNNQRFRLSLGRYSQCMQRATQPNWFYLIYLYTCIFITIIHTIYIYIYTSARRKYFPFGWKIKTETGMLGIRGQQ